MSCFLFRHLPLFPKLYGVDGHLAYTMSRSVAPASERSPLPLKDFSLFFITSPLIAALCQVSKAIITVYSGATGGDSNLAHMTSARTREGNVELAIRAYGSF